ncbi:toxin-antitoxin system YwqK family antitoxin [Chryseobacterium artocarpi]|uniref:toxin-antitoxin system YwqK family antitoxin n=1 Tax=Chryseobacterium artocarpi TaxID=1414727 RepID=UPI003F348754
MKFKKYSLLLLFTTSFAAAQNYYDYDSEVISYSVLSKEITKAYEEAFFKDKMFSPEDFLTDLDKIEKDYPGLKEDLEKSNKLEVNTTLYKNFYSTTPFKNKIIDGIKKIYYPGGMLFQEIPYKNGKLDGIHKVYNESGKLYSEVPYKNNLKNGIKKVYFTNPEERYDAKEYTIQGSYNMGKLIGPVSIFNGNLTITYPSDFKKGKVELIYNGTSLLDYSIIERDNKNGPYTVYSVDTPTNVKTEADKKTEKKKPQRVKRFFANFFNNQFNGYVEKYNRNGELLSKNLFSFGKPVGAHKNYYDIGKIKSEEYYDNNGKKTGTWKTYYPSGELSNVANYKEDQLHGAQELYQHNNLLKTQENLDHGKKISSKYYNDKGNLQSEAYYENEKFTKEIIYFPDGRIQSLQNVNRDKTYYDRDGKVIHVDHYKNGHPIGIHKYFNYEEDKPPFAYSETEYDEDGKKIRSVWYDKKSSNEVSWKNEKMHGKSTYTTNDGAKRIKYHFEGKEVSEKEFKNLSEANQENKKTK